MKFIQLTNPDGWPVLVNPTLIQTICKGDADNDTVITFAECNEWHVQEPVSEVLKRIE